MGISNSTNFNQTRDQIITDALTSIGVLRPGGTAQTSDINFCSNWLNKIVKSWEGQGIHLWKEAEGTLFLLPNISTYTIGTGSGNIAGTNTVETYTSAAASGATLTVNSTVGMTVGDQIGVELDNGTRQWTTIQSITSTTVLVLTTPVSSAASSGVTVCSYTNECEKPMHISSARLRISDSAAGVDRPVYIKGIDEFEQIPSKTTTGKANQMLYRPLLTTGTIQLWPVPDTVSDRLEFSYVEMIDDFDASSDNSDLPTEWLDCLTLTLMHKIAKAYGKDKDIRAELKAEAAEAIVNMQLWDTSQGSYRVVPNYRDDDIS